MKSIKLALIVCSTLMVAATGAIAQTNSHNHNFASKRPYHQPLPASVYENKKDFEGATLVAEDAASSKNKTFRMHMLSKRAY